MSTVRAAMSSSVLIASIALAACSDDAPSHPLGMDGGLPGDGGSRSDAGIDAGHAPDSGALSCDQGSRLINDRLFVTTDSTLRSLQSCSVHADCALLPGRFMCAAQGSSFGLCGLPFAQTQLDAGQAFLGALDSELCPEITSGCHSGPLCPQASALCVEHRCAAADFTAPDGGPL